MATITVAELLIGAEYATPDCVLDAALTFAGDAQQRDDYTLVTVKRV